MSKPGAAIRCADAEEALTAADMLGYIEFRHGKLHLYVDYLRGTPTGSPQTAATRPRP